MGSRIGIRSEGTRGMVMSSDVARFTGLRFVQSQVFAHYALH